MSGSEAARWGARLAVFVPLIAVVLFVGHRYVTRSEAGNLWQQAVDAHNAKNYREALDLYKKAYAAAPESYTELRDQFADAVADVYKALGSDLAMAGKNREAADLYAEWTETAPESARKNGAYFEAARCYYAASLQDKSLRGKALSFAKQALDKGVGEFSRDEVERFIQMIERKNVKP